MNIPINVEIAAKAFLRFYIQDEPGQAATVLSVLTKGGANEHALALIAMADVVSDLIVDSNLKYDDFENFVLDYLDELMCSFNGVDYK